MDVSELDYEFRDELIAQRPAEPRDSSRLMYVGKESTQHLTFRDITGLLGEGDVLVKNKTKVVPARIEAKKVTGGRVEILLYHEREEGLWDSLVKGSGIKEGAELYAGETSLRVERHLGGGRYLLGCRDGDLLMEREGSMPTPPYIKKPLRDRDEYQTVYAREPGSVAAPTAGFHFTQDILKELKGRGVEIHDITLHVGPGTFLPIRTERVEEHSMDSEYYVVDKDTAEGVTKANREGRRLILVGTTTVRAMESVSRGGVVEEGKGWTDIFIYPGYRFQSGMDMFMTNFHLPRSTPLMLTCAFGGKERVLGAYGSAVRKGYRFYSFGDSMLLEGKV